MRLRHHASRSAIGTPIYFTKFSSFGGGGAVSDVAIARFSCFGGDMTETAVIDLVGMV
jgi:hypothetical protein